MAANKHIIAPTDGTCISKLQYCNGTYFDHGMVLCPSI